MDDIEKLLESISLDSTGLYNQFASITSIFNLLLSAFFGILILMIYIKTHRDTLDYTLIKVIPLLTILMTVIMRLQGSNAAVFFGIFGVLSIVRFRSSLTDQKDITFILFSVITGVLIGAGNYILVILSFIVISIVLVILNAVFNTKNKKDRSIFIFSSDKRYTDFKNEIETFLTTNKIVFDLIKIYGSYKENKTTQEIEERKFFEYEIIYDNPDVLISSFDTINEYCKLHNIKMEMKKEKIN